MRKGSSCALVLFEEMSRAEWGCSAGALLPARQAQPGSVRALPSRRASGEGSGLGGWAISWGWGRFMNDFIGGWSTQSGRVAIAVTTAAVSHPGPSPTLGHCEFASALFLRLAAWGTSLSPGPVT